MCENGNGKRRGLSFKGQVIAGVLFVLLLAFLYVGDELKVCSFQVWFSS